MFRPAKPTELPSRLDAPLTSRVASRSSAAWKGRAIGGGSRHEEELDACVLEEPFEFKTRDFHGTQQEPLNAELRAKVERAELGWSEVISQAHGYLTRIAPKASPTNDMLLRTLRDYHEGYNFSGQIPLTTSDIIDTCGLVVNENTLSDVRLWGDFPNESALQLAFKRLATAQTLLPAETLFEIRSTLAVFDRISRQPLSDCSVAFHERHTSDITHALREELEEGAAYLKAIDKRIALSKESRVAALGEGDGRQHQRALDLYQEEVTLGSSLVKLNAQRLGLFADAEEDTRNFKNDVLDLTTAANTLLSYLSVRLRDIERDLGRDFRTLNTTLIPAKEDSLGVLEGKAVSTFAAHCVIISDLHNQEAQVWSDILQRLKVLRQISSERAEAVTTCLGDVERSSAEIKRAMAEHRAMRNHAQTLKDAMEIANKAQFAFGELDSFVAKMSPVLESDAKAFEEETRALKLAEASSVVSRYSQLTETAEDLKQRFRNRLEGLAMVSREKSLALETALSTLDGRTAELEAEKVGAELEAVEVSNSARHVEETLEALREVVDPAFDFAVRELSANNEGRLLSKLGAPSDLHQNKKEDGVAGSGVVAAPTSDCAVGTPQRARKALEAARSGVAAGGIDLSRHPHLAAVEKSLPIADVAVGTAARFVDLEQSAADNRRTDLLRSERALRNCVDQT